MIKFINLINEDINLFSCEVLLKTDRKANKVDIYHKIRAIKDVVVVTIRHSPFLDRKKTEQHEYSLLYIKFIAHGKPSESIRNIGSIGVNGGPGNQKVEGLVQFLPRYESIKKVEVR